MKPYFQTQDGRITIYHGDCREIVPGLEHADIDLVLTDPPYGINLQNHGATNRRRSPRSWRVEGDTSTDVGASILSVCEQYAWPIIAFANPMRPWTGQWRQYLVWDKGPAVGGGGDPSRCWKQTWELIQVARTGPLNGSRDEAILRYWMKPDGSSLHPCQKPISLLSYLIAKATDPDALILDPFMGSGSTLRAAMNLGRSACGIEIEERYAEIAARRLDQLVLPLEAS